MNFKDLWVLWRNLGHVDSNGTWIAPLSFDEALKLPEKMLKVFFALDDLVAKMAKQQSAKGKKGK